MTSMLERKMTAQTPDVLYPSHFAYRHIGPRRADVHEMLELLGYESLDAFIDAVVPQEIRLEGHWPFRRGAASGRCFRPCAAWPA